MKYKIYQLDMKLESVKNSHKLFERLSVLSLTKGNFPIIALVETYNGNETVLRLKENGRFYNDTENSSDLFFAPVKKEGWINLFKVNSTMTTGEIYNTEE